MENNDGNKNDSTSSEKIKYSLLIKNYLKNINNDEEYTSKVNDNPGLLFEKVNEQRLILWETFLFNISSPSGINTDFDILTACPERGDQTVIINDCGRTRVRERYLVPGFQKILEAVLTHYCTTKGLGYKQGLNEIFGPLLLLQYKIKSLKLSKLFDMGEVFIDQFLPNYFYEKDIYSLKCSLSLFTILLRYHEPSVYNRLDSLDIVPEVYATNPLSTLMLGKLKIDLVYELWERIIKTQDVLISHFLLVSLLIYYREMIINCEKSYLATLITALTITSIEELDIIFNKALQLREQTPFSYRILVNKIGFLKRDNKDIREAYEFYQPESIPAMPIFPIEIISITSKTACVDCVDPECKNSKTNGGNALKEEEDEDECTDLWSFADKISDAFLKFQENMNNHICEKCNMKIQKNMQYILLDLRILNYGEEDDDTEKTGFLPMMINVDQDELKSEDFSKIITDRFTVERGNYHFIFLTSSTDNFTKFERDFYMDNMTELDKKKMMFGLIKQSKIVKKLNLDDAQKNLTWKEIYKLKEYDNFRNTLKTMQKENFPYVGYVYGGFDGVHEESFKYDYELLFHDEKQCLLCEEKRKKKSKRKEPTKGKEETFKSIISGSLWEHKEKIKYNQVNEIYKDKNIKTYIAILSKYKGKDYENEKTKLLIIFLIDEYIIELHKFETQKEYKDIQVDNDTKEAKQKKLKYYDLGKETSEDKEQYLILFEKFSVTDIIALNKDDKIKNIVNMEIRDNTNEKEKEKNNIKKDKEKKSKDKNNKKIISINSFEIVLDFSSVNDSTNFSNDFNRMIKKFKENKK